MRNTFDYFDEGTYLAHHGIKGQKWDIRRYQNPDGSLTSEGQKRYLKDATSAMQSDTESFRRMRGRAVQASKDSKELSAILEEAKKLASEENNDYEKWLNDKNRVRETARSYLKKRYNENATEKDLDEYLKQAGSDSYVYMWDHEISKHPAMEKRREKSFELQTKYRDASKKYFEDLLGKYGNAKIPTSRYGLTVSDYMAYLADNTYWDLVLDDLVL